MGIFSVFKKTNVLYFPGCITYFKFPEKFELYTNIFDKLGIDFRLLDNQVCCGLEALEAGYEAEARKIMRKNLEIFRENGVQEIITNDPACLKAFSQDYSDMPDWNIQIINIWDLIFAKLESKPKLIKQKTFEKVVYHDPCYLGRYMGVYDSPRNILRLLGYELKEFIDNRENSFCCGSCGGLSRTNPELADKIAKERILQAKRLGIKKIIVASLDNYKILKKNTTEGIEIKEMSEVLAEAIGIKQREISKEDEAERINEEVIDIREENIA
ncbi:MAG: (Fe-S)-binding protein [Candidatus Pacearchaeota archaeon]